ncbi:MAG: hypothetical protein BRD40_00005, partial [Bacteroidetes bacterium QS_1_65_9]
DGDPHLLYAAHDGVRVEGELGLPSLLNVDAEISTLQITQGEGVNLTGSVELDRPVSLYAAELRELSLDFDTEAGNFMGEGELAVDPLFGLEAEASILGGQLDALSLEVGGGTVPIGNTGLAFTSGGGSVSGLANPPPLTMGLMVDIEPVVQQGFEAVKLDDLTLEYTFDTKITGRGGVELFGADMGGARLTIIPSSKAEVDGRGNFVNVLVGQAHASLHNTASGLNLNGGSRAGVRVPHPDEFPGLEFGFPLDWIASKAGLPYDIKTMETTITNTRVSATETILKVLEFTYALDWGGSRLTPSFDGNLELLNAGIFSKQHLERTAARRAQARLEGRSLVVSPGRANSQLEVTNGAMQQRFTLDRSTPMLAIRVEGPGAAPEYDLTLPGGARLTPQTASQRSGTDFSTNGAQSKGFYVLQSPPQGTYTIELPDQDTYQIDVFGANTAPFIEVSHSGMSGGGLDLSYTASDPDDEAEVSLFYDNDNRGQDGVLIEEGLSAEESTYTWDTSELPSGTYYVYATASDEKNAPAVDYAEQSLTVVADGAPSAPTGLDAAPQDTTVELGWNTVPEADAYTLYYARQGEALNLDEASTLGVGDTTSFSFAELTPGPTYRFAVAAADTAGRQSAFSNVARVEYTSASENNAPTIANRRPPTIARVGRSYDYALGATDPDGDALSYTLSSSAPSGLGVSGGQLAWTPSASETGVYSVQVIARDDAGAADSLSYTLTALSKDDARGRLSFSRALYVGYETAGAVTLSDPGLNTAPAAVDSQQVRIYSRAQPGGQSRWLIETSANSGRFTAMFGLGETNGGGAGLPVQEQDSLSVEYEDAYPEETIVATSTFSADSSSTRATKRTRPAAPSTRPPPPRRTDRPSPPAPRRTATGPSLPRA